MAYIVIFETDNPAVRTSIKVAVEALGSWSALASNSYLLDTSRSIRAIMETLQPILGPTDDLWIFTASGPWSGYGDPVTDDHLCGQLGEAQDYIQKDWDPSKGSRS